MTTPAGWYPDPHDQTQQRYWDSNSWTEHQAPAAVVAPLGRKEGRAARKAEEARVASEAVSSARAEGQWWAGTARGVVGSADYLGTNGRGKASGTVKITDAGIQWTGGMRRVRIPWAGIEAITIDGQTSSRLTVTRALTVGVFALGMRKQSQNCLVVVSTPRSDHGFVFSKTPSIKISNAFKSVTHALATKATGAATVGVDESLELTEDPPAASVSEDLARLVTLRDSGALTDQEFSAAKARLLGL